MFTYRDERDDEFWERQHEKEIELEVARRTADLQSENGRLRLELERVKAELERHRKVWD